MRVALFEGYQSRGRRALFPRGTPRQWEGFGGIGCGEFSALKDRLAILIDQAETLGITESNAYTSAKAFYEQHSGWNSDVVLVGSYCTAAVIEGNDRIAKLNATIVAAGVSPVIDTPPDFQPPSDDTPIDTYTSTIKWVVGGAIAVAGAVVVVQVMSGLKLFKKATRLRGYGGKRRGARR